MALSIEHEPTLDKWSIPLFGQRDEEWKDNTWIVGHLRQLADKIEEEEPKIYTVSIELDAQYKIPFLTIRSFKKR